MLCISIAVFADYAANNVGAFAGSDPIDASNRCAQIGFSRNDS